MGPLLLHVRTEKGRGYLPAEAASDRMHGVGKYDVKTGQQEKAEGKVVCKPFCGHLIVILIVCSIVGKRSSHVPVFGS